MITLKDVARESGVSPGTVSDILNGRTGVKYGRATVAKVKGAAERIGYRRDRAASALRGGKSRTAGILVPDLANPFYVSIMTRVMARLRAEGYAVLVEECQPTVDPSMEADSIRDLTAGRIDGLFALTIHSHAHGELFRSLREDGIAVIAAGAEMGIDTFAIDFRPGLRDLARAAIQMGHRSFVFVGDCPWDLKPGERYEELRNHFSESGVLDHSPTTIPCDQNTEAARVAFSRYWRGGSSGERPTLAVAINDQLALGVLRACRDLRLTVPGDLSVVGFDNTPQGAASYLALTSIGASLSTVADRCSNLLLSRMSGRTDGGPRSMIFEAELNLRETLGAPLPKLLS